MEFHEVNEHNYADVLSLSVNEVQASFIESNVHSIATSYVFHDEMDIFPYSVVVDEKTVGFLILGVEDSCDEIYIWHMMVDQHNQGRGFGSEVLSKVINHVGAHTEAKQILVSLRPDNQYSASFLLKRGFVFDCVMDDGNHQFIYNIARE